MSEESAMSAATVSIWHILGIEQTDDERSIKRAYAKQLKANRPEDDAAAFQLLREAYEHALRIAAFLRARAAQAGTPASSTEEVAPEAKPAPAIKFEKPLDAASQPTVSSPAAAVVPPQPIAPQPVQTATELWSGLFRFEEANRLWRLKTITAGDALLNLEVRHEFELLVLRFCAGPECSDSMRDALIRHFAWDNDAQHLRRLDAFAAHALVARCRAAWSLKLLGNDPAIAPVLKFLLASKPPKLSVRLTDSSFTGKMLGLVETIRSHHPELLAYKLNSSVFDWWERRTRAKRYFVDTAVYSFLGGLGLLVVYFVLERGLLASTENQSNFAPFLMTQAVAFGLGAIVAFYLSNKIASAKTFMAKRAEPLLSLRYQDAWQFGWLPPSLVLFLLTFNESPSPLLVWGVRTGMVLTAAAALFATSAGFTAIGIAQVLFVGLCWSGLMVQSQFGGFGYLTFACGGIALAAQYVRGGASLLAFSGLPLRYLSPLRLAWLAGAAGIMYFALTAFKLELQLAALVFAWTFIGILLSRPQFRIWSLPMLVVLSVLLDVMERACTYKIGDARLHLMLVALEYVAFTMLLNMWRARSTKQNFS
jgi:hypothetical protein